MAFFVSVQVGLLLLSKVVGSNPEPFKPHYKQLLQLFGTVLQDLNNPTALYYCILTLTSITAYTGTEEMVCSISLVCDYYCYMHSRGEENKFRMLFFCLSELNAIHDPQTARCS